MPDIGIMFRLNDPASDPARQYEAGLQLIEAADRLGISSAWITSHHFGSDKGTIPSPLLYLAAAAQRTKRIRLGAAVVVLPLENPIRVAEDAALADLLAKGRLQLGLGSGLENWAFDAFGIDWDGRHELFNEKLAQLRRILAGELLGGGRRLYPAGAQLLDKIWRVGTELDDVRRIADDGDNLLLGASKKHTLPENRQRQAIAIAEFRRRAAPRQRIAVSRYLYAAKDSETAQREFAAAPSSPVKPGTVPFRFEEAAIAGSPDEIRRALEADRQIPLIDDLFIQIFPARVTLRQWISSLTLLAREVFPPGSPLRAEAALPTALRDGQEPARSHALAVQA